MSRLAADQVIENAVSDYQSLIEEFGDLVDMSGRVPKMLGVDEDMRDWSLLMILDHNRIVNGAVKNVVVHLGNGQQLPKDKEIDTKHDVMPGHKLGDETIALFFESITDYQKSVRSIDSLEGQVERLHPVFGMFNAHQWHCMFGFHLHIHVKQAKKLLLVLQG